MVKTFNSETAKQLARSNGIQISDIYTHRDDGKVTMDNVKCAILKRHRFGVFVQLQLRIDGINPTKTNMQLLKQWFSKHSPSAKYVADVSDIRVHVVPADIRNYPNLKYVPMTIQIDYRLHDTRRSVVDYANQFIIDPDDDGNYPIYVKNGRITSIDRNVPNKGEAMLVIGRIINSGVTPMGSNNFGKNFGIGMMGNPTPFQRR